MIGDGLLVAVSKKRTWNSGSPIHQGWGWFFLSPFLIGFSLFVVLPFFASLYWSFFQYDLMRPPKPVGLENYWRLAQESFSKDGVGLALQNSFYYSIVSVPLTVGLGLLLAILLRRSVWGKTFFLSSIFLPTLVPVVSVAVLWVWLLDPSDGWINYWIQSIGGEPQGWLNQGRSAGSLEGLKVMVGSLWSGKPVSIFGSKDALVLVSLWTVGNIVVIFISAMNNLSESVREAAILDGAGPIRRVIHVTIPSLAPVILFNLVVGIIQSLQVFSLTYLMSEGTGGADGSMLLLPLFLFLTGLGDLEMGFASAVAWVTFVGLLIIISLLFRISRRWMLYRES